MTARHRMGALSATPLLDKIVSNNRMPSQTLPNGDTCFDLWDHILCNDGTVLSVQASRYHYCSPSNNVGPYVELEVGYPTHKPPSTWREFCEDWRRPTRTVYAYVPVELVRAFILSHGGERGAIAINERCTIGNLLKRIWLRWNSWRIS